MILTSILGIISGLGGSIATGLLNNKQQKLKNAHEIAMVEAETNAMIAEANANIKITEVEMAKEIELANIENFQVSQAHGNKTNISNEILKILLTGWTKPIGILLAFMLGLVDVVRTAMRPAITIALLWITIYMTYRSVVIVLDSQMLLSPEQVFELIKSVVYLTFTVIGWWFGDRGFKKLAFFK